MRVEGVYVGTPSVLGVHGREEVLSGITKSPVGAAEVALGEINLDGDDQADRTVHGGVDKAVYVYPAEHYPAWAAEDFDVSVAGFGENVSTAGADEATVRIGDVWAWGGALVQVSQPRTPCFKLAMKTGRKDIAPAMIDSGRSGWYLRVLREGTVPTSGVMALEERDENAPTVQETYLVSFANPARLPADRRDAFLRLAERVVSTPALARQYGHGLRAKVARFA
ncbi:MOSC domain-containing protein [Amycolatopsis minnesotensis]|uniref:MOSC domain-containing protein n=1 Tax=Amycolatopsis minnesotensis TaxID=337894 RepID=UPI0031D680AC